MSEAGVASIASAAPKGQPRTLSYASCFLSSSVLGPPFSDALKQVNLQRDATERALTDLRSLAWRQCPKP